MQISKAVALASLLAASAQQPGTNEREENPTVRLTECTTSEQCTSKDLKVTLDANWRWTHKSGTNCYEGNQWFCDDPVQCASECVVEGVSANKYRGTYGIEQIDNGVKLGFVTDHSYGRNVGARLYMLDESGERYKMFYLKNREFAMTFDVSAAMCGMNGAMYFVEMDRDGGKGLGNNAAGAPYGTGYCDAQCPHDMKWISGEANVIDWVANPNDPGQSMGVGKYGSCCGEMDIWEANSMANAYTPHPCNITGTFRCEGIDCGDNDKGERYDGVCDKDGCDINPYRMGNRMFYGRGSEYEVNTLKPVTVVTQFLTTDGTDNGELSEMRRFYVQDGNVIYSPSSTILGPDDTDSITDAFCAAKKTLFGDVNDYARKGNSAAMGESLDRGHVMAISLWDDVAVNMLWLDSAYPLNKPATAPGVQRGDCPGGEESTPVYLRQTHPDGWVSFQDAFVGPIGSYLQQPTTTRAPTPPTPPPTPRPSLDGDRCCHGGCSGNCQGGWCAQSQANCEGPCNGDFCPAQPPPTQAPAPPAGCTDSNANCGNWAASGQCEANPAYMLVNCAQSCGVCNAPTQAPAPPTPPPCADANENCGNWAASGECEANPAYMTVNCALSCGVCSQGASLKNTKRHV